MNRVAPCLTAALRMQADRAPSCLRTQAQRVQWLRDDHGADGRRYPEANWARSGRYCRGGRHYQVCVNGACGGVWKCWRAGRDCGRGGSGSSLPLHWSTRTIRPASAGSWTRAIKPRGPRERDSIQLWANGYHTPTVSHVGGSRWKRHDASERPPRQLARCMWPQNVQGAHP